MDVRSLGVKRFAHPTSMTLTWPERLHRPGCEQSNARLGESLKNAVQSTFFKALDRGNNYHFLLTFILADLVNLTSQAIHPFGNSL